MKFYVNTREAKTERPHIHVCRGKGRTNDAKIWLAPEVSLGTVRGEFPVRDINAALKIARVMRMQFIEDYQEKHGKGRGRR